MKTAPGIRHLYEFFNAGRPILTQGAYALTHSETLPMLNRSNPVSPFDPMTTSCA